MSPRSTPPLRGGSFPLPWEWDSIKTSVFTRPPNRDSSTVMVVHDVDDVEHWLRSPKRDEFFSRHGMTVKTFVDPEGGNQVGVVIESVPSLGALNEALQTAEAAAAMKHDGVHSDTIHLFVAS